MPASASLEAKGPRGGDDCARAASIVPRDLVVAGVGAVYTPRSELEVWRRQHDAKNKHHFSHD
eukprot:scaffold15671_cov38-Phaeocystis_antarctica.AAC.2